MAFSAQLLLSSSSGYSRNRVSRVAASAPEFVGMLSSPQSTKKAGRRTGGDGDTLTFEVRPDFDSGTLERLLNVLERV